MIITCTVKADGPNDIVGYRAAIAAIQKYIFSFESLLLKLVNRTNQTQNWSFQPGQFQQNGAEWSLGE